MNNIKKEFADKFSGISYDTDDIHKFYEQKLDEQRNKVIDEVESLLTTHVATGYIDMVSVNVEQFINKLKEVSND